MQWFERVFISSDKNCDLSNPTDWLHSGCLRFANRRWWSFEQYVIGVTEAFLRSPVHWSTSEHEKTDPFFWVKWPGTVCLSLWPVDVLLFYRWDKPDEFCQHDIQEFCRVVRRTVFIFSVWLFRVTLLSSCWINWNQRWKVPLWRESFLISSKDSLWWVRSFSFRPRDLWSHMLAFGSLVAICSMHSSWTWIPSGTNLLRCATASTQQC